MAAPNFSVVLAAVDHSTAIAAVLGVFAALAGFAVIWKCCYKILDSFGYFGTEHWTQEDWDNYFENAS